MLKEQYSPTQWVTGSDFVANTLGWIAKNTTAKQYAPIAQLDSGECVLWDPSKNDGSQTAVYLTPFAFTTGTAAEAKNLIKAGTFNPELVAWPSGTTDAQKLTAFVGTPISLQAPR